jgi:hypothetical protein
MYITTTIIIIMDNFLDTRVLSDEGKSTKEAFSHFIGNLSNKSAAHKVCAYRLYKPSISFVLTYICIYL